jgi:DNA-damage-inducible protein J
MPLEYSVDSARLAFVSRSGYIQEGFPGGRAMPSKIKSKGSAAKAAAKKGRNAAKLAQSGMIRARISPELKAEAESILNQIGLSSSDAIRMFYRQVTMHNGLPFEARIPNATTRKALLDAEAGKNLTRYADTDDLFRKLGVKRGQG